MNFNPTVFIGIVSAALLFVVLIAIWEEIGYRRCKKRCVSLEAEIRSLRAQINRTHDLTVHLHDYFGSEIAKIEEQLKDGKHR